ncbi:hypothetical protein STCU_07835 [Strigomonas culicis]|uniref:Uncharacterized protein n=1 Tax=Strigomonas culicis TaxID=28005 RepID=S9U2L2_9TRYP|nr:hypothetical protein STCU_07835 [Strigomonas culicis]|eukprot:EPY23168.1 hypothetical protein STCU_07835 [Strigomonas culicis]
MGGFGMRKKSFCGPESEMDRQQSIARRRSSIRFQSTANIAEGAGDGNAADGMARHGSKFINRHSRNTQDSVSIYGAMDDKEDVHDLKQYYGDMAARQEQKELDGVKTVRSYRGAVDEGEDMGKPRRVTTTRNHTGKATGYGGINFKRDIAMRRGEQWGDLEVRPGDKTRALQAPVMVMVDAPVVPQVFNKEDVHSYSNLSDVFADGAVPGDDDENEFGH